MQIDFPFRIGAPGRTASASDAAHVRDMIEQVLLTNPGERVNRPDFGCGLLQATFAPNSPELATAFEFTTRAALQRWLGDLLVVQTLTIVADDARLQVELQYVLRLTGDVGTETFDLRGDA